MSSIVSCILIYVTFSNYRYKVPLIVRYILINFRDKLREDMLFRGDGIC